MYNICDRHAHQWWSPVNQHMLCPVHHTSQLLMLLTHNLLLYCIKMTANSRHLASKKLDSVNVILLLLFHSVVLTWKT